jgi:predicted TIM-barrel fold metal-dependent hydrolase
MSETRIAAVDADGHVIESSALIDEYLPRSVSVERRSPDVLLVNGVNILDRPSTPWMVLTSTDTRYRAAYERGFDAVSQLEMMDVEGFEAAALYPSVFLYVPFSSAVSTPDSVILCEAYNDWLVDFCAADPKRLLAIGLLPLGDVDAACGEAERVRAKGARAVMVRPNPVNGRNLGDPVYDRLYSTLEDLDLALTVHEGLSVRIPQLGRDRFDRFFDRHMACHPWEQQAACLSLIVDGALERHPRLRVAFLESGTGWLSYWLGRMDQHYEWLHAEVDRLVSMKPSEYFRRQCFISADPEDRLVHHAIEYVGDENILYASDYPHPDAEYPGILKEFLDAPQISATSKQRILVENPRRLYGL